MTRRARIAWVLVLVVMAACARWRGRGHAISSRGALEVHADPHLVTLSVDATQTLVLASRTDELGIRIRIAAGELPASKRPPLNLALALDTSGSMEGAAIDALRASAKRLVRELRDGDRIAVITFDSQAALLVPSVVIDSHSRGRVDKALDAIAARGTTDLYGGLAAALGQVTPYLQPHGINRIVLLSDGVPNSSQQLPALISTIRASGVAVTSLGLGIDYDSTLMAQIARDTGGAFHFLERPDAIAAVLHDELGKMTTVVARNLTLALQPGPGVTIDAMPGLTLGGDGKLIAMVGDLPAGETRELVLPIRVAARAAGSTVELVSATLTFDDLVGGSGQQHRDAYVGVKASSDEAAVHRSVKLALEIARVRTAAAAAILESLALARGGQLPAARERLAGTMALVRRESIRAHELDEIVAELEAVAREIEELHAQAADQPMIAPESVETGLRKRQSEAERAIRGVPRR